MNNENNNNLDEKLNALQNIKNEENFNGPLQNDGNQINYFNNNQNNIAQPNNLNNQNNIVQPNNFNNQNNIAQPNNLNNQNNIAQPNSFNNQNNIVQSNSFNNQNNIAQPNNLNNQNNIVQPNSFNNQNNIVQPNGFNNQNIQSTNNINSNKKNNTVLFIILGVVIFLIIAILVVILGVKLFYYNYKKTDNGSITRYTEYENKTVTTTKNTNEVYEYKGFKFNKIKGYSYSEKGDGLYIQNNEFVFYIQPNKGKFGDLKNMDLTDQLMENMNDGTIVKNRKVASYNGVEVVSYECENNSKNTKALLLYSSYPNNEFTMVVSFVSIDNSFDYSGIDEYSKIISNSSFNVNGDTTSFSENINLSN